MEGALPDLHLSLSDKKVEQIVKVEMTYVDDCVCHIVDHSSDCTESSSTTTSNGG